MWPRFGIKVGNSTLCIAQVKSDGKVDVIANKQGDRVSQACLLWDGSNEIECGLTAKQKMATRPKQAVAHSFQLLLPDEYLNDVKIANATKDLSCEYDASKKVFKLSHLVFIDQDNLKENVKLLSAYDVHVQLFRAELELARQYYSEAEKKPTVVLSIPAYYPQEAYTLLADAAKAAGFHVAQIVCESTAAVLAYGIGENTPADDDNIKYVLTIKCGGLNSDFALYSVQYGYITELATFGPYAIGGQQYTEALVQFICAEFQRKYKLDPLESRRCLSKIHTAASNCKHILTALPSTQLYIDSLMDGIDYNLQMSRARFESLIQPVINNFMQTLNECVEQALATHTQVTRIDDIVLLGATTQIPKLQAAVAARFPDSKLHNTLSADEVVAIGCARQALYLLEPTEEQYDKIDNCVLSLDDLYIWRGNNAADAKLLVGKGTVLPTKITVELKQSSDTDKVEDFTLRNSGNEIIARLSDTTVTEEGLYQLEVEIDLDNDNDVAGNKVPLVKLRCM